MYAIHLDNNIRCEGEYIIVFTFLSFFAWSIWYMNIKGVFLLSIKPGYVHMKNKNARIQKLTYVTSTRS